MKIVTTLVAESKDWTISHCTIDGRSGCYFLQDGKVGGGVNGKGRIPAGTYNVRLRTVGTKHIQYLAKFGKDFHKGMLELMNVPNYDAILIHIGNDPKDTLGCLLTGTIANKKGGEYVGTISGSTMAYEFLYAQVRDELMRGRPVSIEVRY